MGVAVCATNLGPARTEALQRAKDFKKQEAALDLRIALNLFGKVFLST